MNNRAEQDLQTLACKQKFARLELFYYLQKLIIMFILKDHPNKVSNFLLLYKSEKQYTIVT